jgi:hypothetical protein
VNDAVGNQTNMAQNNKSTVLAAAGESAGFQSAEGASDLSSGSASKRPDKLLRYRCGVNGHLADDCKAFLCIYCESAKHPAKDCPLLSMLKPTAITYGLTRSELLFYEAPASSNIYFKHDSGKVGRVSVSGGDMTIKELIKELDWIVLGAHQWDIQTVGDHAFKVVFPSKADLNRVNKIKDIPVDSNMFLHFKEWSASDLDKFLLQKNLGESGWLSL